MKAIVSKTMAKKKRIKFIIICAAAFVLLCVIGAVLAALTLRPEILEKDSFTEEDKAVIAQQLGIPDEAIEIQHMKFTHAKDSYFCITVKSDDIGTLWAYEPPENNEVAEPVYIKRDEEDIHGNITCTVKSKEPYIFEFELYKWNKELYEIVKE